MWVFRRYIQRRGRKLEMRESKEMKEKKNICMLPQRVLLCVGYRTPRQTTCDKFRALLCQRRSKTRPHVFSLAVRKIATLITNSPPQPSPCRVPARKYENWVWPSFTFPSDPWSSPVIPCSQFQTAVSAVSISPDKSRLCVFVCVKFR